MSCLICGWRLGFFARLYDINQITCFMAVGGGVLCMKKSFKKVKNVTLSLSQ